MAAPSTSKIVCLRAFNEDLAAKPWQSQTVTPPPPIPKRIAWPGGKIVSNKDEALASFLRRKLNQGQKLTPEQLAMLAKMTTDSESGETPKVVAAASNKNIKRKFGGDAWRSSGDGAIATVEARSLLHKLERKARKCVM